MINIKKYIQEQDLYCLCLIDQVLVWPMDNTCYTPDTRYAQTTRQACSSGMLFIRIWQMRPVTLSILFSLTSPNICKNVHPKYTKHQQIWLLMHKCMIWFTFKCGCSKSYETSFWWNCEIPLNFCPL